MTVRATAVRLAVFCGVLVLTLLPGPIGLALSGNFGSIAWLVDIAWRWQLIATLPAGIARVPFAGEILFENTSGSIAVAFWLLVGIATAAALQRLRLAWFAAAALAVILASGIGAHLLLEALGYAMYILP